MKEFRKTMFASILVNILLVIVKFTMGLISNYKSLIADAIHSFSDLSTDVVAIFGQWLSMKKEDNNHPYGHGKIEYITSIIIGVVIMCLGISMISTSITGDLAPTSHRIIALLAVLITIILKYCLASYIILKGKKTNNCILIASGKESMSDVLSAASVFIAIILSMYEDKITFFAYADKIAGIIISLLIIKTAFVILKDNINAIIGECEQNEEVIYRIKGLIMSVPEVLSIDHLIVMKFGSYYQIMLDAGVDSDCSLEEAHNIAHNIEKELLDSDMKTKYVVVHINPCKKVLA
jgi:cation diffusion facilitator family transporter